MTIAMYSALRDDVYAKWVKFEESHKGRSDYLGCTDGNILYAKSNATLPFMLSSLNTETFRAGEGGDRYSMINYKLDGENAVRKLFLILQRERRNPFSVYYNYPKFPGF
jgi:hypothetical protein